MGREILCNWRTLTDESLLFVEFVGGRRRTTASDFFFFPNFKFGVLRTVICGGHKFYCGKDWKSVELWATQCFLYICFVTLGPMWSHWPLGCHRNSIRLGRVYS